IQALNFPARTVTSTWPSGDTGWPPTPPFLHQASILKSLGVSLVAHESNQAMVFLYAFVYSEMFGVGYIGSGVIIPIVTAPFSLIDPSIATNSKFHPFPSRVLLFTQKSISKKSKLLLSVQQTLYLK